VSSKIEPRHVASTAVGTGLIASMAANVAHGLVGSGGAGAVISGLFWPLGLLLAIEVAVRLPWPAGRWWMTLRIAATTPVAAAAAIVSYLHMNGLLSHWHEHWLVCLIGPVAVDGLTTLGAASLLVLDRSALLAESVQDVSESLTEAPHEPTQPAVDHRPIEPTHPVSPQVSESRPDRTPVSQEALDKVMAAVGRGQPMGKAAIMTATGLGRSTAGRALAHLVAVGRLATIGKATQPDYVLAQRAGVEVAS
jgi:hypothetical protein